MSKSVLISSALTTGNALADGKRGWFVGQFVTPELGLRHRNDFEVKWGVHQKGDRKVGEWTSNEVSSTISILIEGTFNLWFKVNGEVVEVPLRKIGDYAIWNALIPHTWEALADCVILTVRAPSINNDQRNV